MKLPRILFKGQFSPDQIKVTINPHSNRKIDASLEKKLAKVWSELLQQAKEENKKIWDANLYRLNNFSIKGDQLLVELTTTRFSLARAMAMLKREVESLGEECFSKSIYLTSLVETKDNKYVVAELSGNYITFSSRSLIGGVLSKDELEVKNGQDIFNALYKEFKEEVNINRTDVDNIVLSGAILNLEYKVGLFFKTNLNLKAKEVLEKFRENHDDELKGITLLSKSELLTFLQNQNQNYQLLISFLED